MSDVAAVSAQSQQPTLAKGALGLAGQLFQSITHMAPAAGIIFSVQYMASQGGASHTLAYILATVACLFSALCLKELVRKIRSAGGYFVIHSVALGHGAGFTTSWLYFLYDPIIVAAASLLWPAVFAAYLKAYLGIDIPWWIFSFVMSAVLFTVCYVGVRQAAKVSMVLGTIETVVMLALGVVLIAKAGGNQPVVSLLPSSSPSGWGGVFFATTFAILSFLGFEAGVPLAEESHNAKRNVVVGIMVSTIGIGIFYCVLGYATVAGWAGIHDAAVNSTYIDFSHWTNADAQSFGTEFSGAQNPFFGLGTRAFGVAGPLIVLLLITNSMFAVGVAAMSAVSRVVYSLGRSGAFPRWFSHVNARTQTPDHSILAVTLAGLAIALFFGLVIGPDPITSYGLMGLLATVGAIIVYLMTNLSVFVLYRQQYRSEFKVLDHVVYPILATIFFIPPLVASLFPRALDIVGMGFDNVYPVSLGLPISVGWAILGVLIYIYLNARKKSSLIALASEMAIVELVGEEDDPTSRAVRNA